MSCLWPQRGHSRRPGFLPEVLTVNETPESGRWNDRYWEELPLVQVRRKVFLRPVSAIGETSPGAGNVHRHDKSTDHIGFRSLAVRTSFEPAKRSIRAWRELVLHEPTRRNDFAYDRGRIASGCRSKRRTADKIQSVWKRLPYFFVITGGRFHQARCMYLSDERHV